MAITNLMDCCLHAFVLSLPALMLYFTNWWSMFYRGILFGYKTPDFRVVQSKGCYYFSDGHNLESFIYLKLVVSFDGLVNKHLWNYFIKTIYSSNSMQCIIAVGFTWSLFCCLISSTDFSILLFGKFRADIQCYHFAKSLQNAGFARFTLWCSCNSNSKQPYNFVWVVQCLNWPCQT